MILDEQFERKLTNLFLNSRDQGWTVEEFGQYFADFRRVVADDEPKKRLSSKKLFRVAFDPQSPNHRFRHYFKYILSERIISFEEFIYLLEGQNIKDLDIQSKLLKIINDCIEIILCPASVLTFGYSLANFISWLLEIYSASVDNIPTKKQDISKKDFEILTNIQQTLEKITKMDNFRYFRSLLYVVKNDAENKELAYQPIYKKIDEKMSNFTEQTIKKLYEDFCKTMKSLKCDKLDIIQQTQEKQQQENPFSTRLNNQNSIHLLSVWAEVECVKFDVDSAVDRLLLLTKYFGLNFQTTLEVILITNIQKFTEYQEPIPDEMELSYYTFAYHRLVPFIRKFVDRRNEIYFNCSASSPSMSSEEISCLIIEILTNRIDWLKMIVNQMNGLLLVNFFFKLEKEKLVESAKKLRQLIDPSFLDQSEETFFGKVLKFEQLITDFLDNKHDKAYQISLLHDLDIEISLLNFIISAKFMNKLEDVFECLLALADDEKHFDSSFLMLISILLNDNNLDILNTLPDRNDSFTLKFLKHYLFRKTRSPKVVRQKFKNSYTQISANQEFHKVLEDKNSGTITNQQFIFFVQRYVMKNLKIFLKDPSHPQLDSFYEDFTKLSPSYQILGYLSVVSFVYKEPFNYSKIQQVQAGLKETLQNSELFQKNDLFSRIDRKCSKDVRNNDFILFQEDKIEWSQKLLCNVRDSQTLTRPTMELYNDIFRRLGPSDFTRWLMFTLFLGPHDVQNMDNAVRLAFLLFQNKISECTFTLINLVAEWLLFKSHSTHDFDQTRDDLNRCLIKLMLMCVNAVIKLRLQTSSNVEMDYLCQQQNSPRSINNENSKSQPLVIMEFKNFLNDFVQINSSQDAIFRQTILTILFEETRNCFEEQTCNEFLPLYKSIVERLVKYATDGITYETIIAFFPLDKREFREHSANLLYMLNQSQNVTV